MKGIIAIIVTTAALGFCLFMIPMMLMISAAEDGKSLRIKPTEKIENVITPSAEKWAILIGIDKYEDMGINPLKYTVKDVEELYKVMITTPDGFKPDNVILMTPNASNPLHRPTRSNILAMLNSWLKLANVDDTILLYYSGHGIEQDNNSYILPQDAKTSAIKMTSINIEYLKDTLRNSKTQKRMLILDACHSGAGKAAGTMGRGFANSLEEAKGMVMLASCDLNESSYEMDDLKHGAFTYFLMEALKGNADRNKDRELWASEVNYYVWDNTRKWAAKNGLQQTPKYVNAVSGEIVLAKFGTPIPPIQPIPPDSEPPRVEIIQPAEWRNPGAVLKVQSTLKTLHIVGLATDNTGIGSITVNGQSVSFTAVSSKDLQLVPLRGKTVRFETDISIKSGISTQNIMLRLYDTANNVADASYQLQLLPSGLPKTIIGKDGAEMVLIPAGEFLMGSPEGEGDSDEHPQHTVYLDTFYIDKYEVTKSQYKKFMDATGHAAPLHWNDDRFNNPNQPVVGVTWFDAVAYCKWANKRLPTEAEWEKAARGTDRRRYPWGNEAPNAGGWRANYDPGNRTDDGFEFTAPVGSFPSGVSPYGVMDMAGNVSEWVADWYNENYYEVSPSRNPKGSNRGIYRVLRGGSWLNFAKPYVQYGRPATRSHLNFLRVADRIRFVPDVRYDYIGFRCAQNATP